MSNYEFGAGIWMFQQFVDRYATDAYGPPVSTLEAIERAAAVGDIKVLDINYPFAGLARPPVARSVPFPRGSHSGRSGQHQHDTWNGKFA